MTVALLKPIHTLRAVGALIFLVLLGTGCSYDEEPPVPRDTVTDVLVELHLHQSIEDLNIVDKPVSRQDIFEAYNVSEEQLEDALRYYANRPEQYKRLYDDVMERLRTELNPERRDEDFDGDSVYS